MEKETQEKIGEKKFQPFTGDSFFIEHTSIVNGVIQHRGESYLKAAESAPWPEKYDLSLKGNALIKLSKLMEVLFTNKDSLYEALKHIEKATEILLMPKKEPIK